jgi:4-diphosphocytidyl-2-C-methyl-D-erythritol kinase
VAPEDNLIRRAASLLQQHTKTSLGADIRLLKRLPMGGGIGGGSSNAATTLLALNRLWQCGLDSVQLQQLGVRLGADVPIFLHGHAAFAEGVGERLTDVAIAEPWYLVLVPQVHVSTAQIFSHQELTRNSEIMKMSAFFEQGSRNDCEALVRKLYPAVDDAMRWLSQHGPARLTGTGACVYCPCDSHPGAKAIADQVPQDWHGFIAKGCNESPLHRALARL